MSGPDGPRSPLRGLPIEFVGTFPDPAVRLDPPLPEIAFIGRSNVGKSSLINALTGRRNLARVSGTPGKTTALNVYRLPAFYLVDLPGYGFARAAKSTRAGYRKLITGYLTTRARLTGVVWLLDIRHDPSADDREMQRLLVDSGRPVLCALTKADKLGRRQSADRVRALAAELDLPVDQLQPTSSEAGTGIADLGESILAAVEAA